MMRELVVLGVRLSRPEGYTARLQQALLFIGLTTSTFVVLFGLAVPGALTQKAERISDLTPRLAASDSHSALRALDPASVNNRRWGGEEVTRTVVSRPVSGSEVSIPGVPRAPAEGEAFISPALSDRMQSNPTLKALVGDYTVAGMITHEGLASPRELRLIAGVTQETAGLRKLTAFGAEASGVSAQETAAASRSVGILVAVVVGVPMAALVALCARLGSRQRSGRVRALRQLGLSQSATRFILVVEAMLVAVPAMLTGCVLYELAVRLSNHIPADDLNFFSGDLQLSPWSIVFALLFVFAFTGVCAGVGVRSSESSPRQRAPTAKRRAGYGVAGAAALVLVGLQLSGAGASTAVGLWVAVALLAGGVAVFANRLVSGVSRWAAPMVRRGGSLVGLRLNIAEPGSTVRLGSVIGSLVVCLAVAAAFLTILNNPNGGASSSTDNKIVVSAEDFGRTLNLRDVQNTPGVVAAAPVVDVEGDKDTIPTLVATCSHLEKLAGVSPRGCSTSPGWLRRSILDSWDEPRGPSESTVATLDGKQAPLPDPNRVIGIPGKSNIFTGLLLVPPELTQPDARARRYLLRVAGNEQAVVFARISSQAPSAGFDLSGMSSGDSDTREYADQAAWLTRAALLSVLITCLALIIAAGGEAEARRNRLRGLRVLGAPRRDLVWSHLSSVLAPLLMVSISAMVAALAAVLTLHWYDERAAVSSSFAVGLCLGATGISVLVTLATLPTALRPMSESELARSI